MSSPVNQADFARGSWTGDRNDFPFEFPARNRLRGKLRKKRIALSLGDHLDKRFNAAAFKMHRGETATALAAAAHIDNLLPQAVLLGGQPELA